MIATDPNGQDDVIVGTTGADTINGWGGDDVICGNGGRDILLGGSGATVQRLHLDVGGGLGVLPLLCGASSSRLR